MYKLICMSFDGEYQTEDGGRFTDRKGFDTIEAAWEHSNDLGSKWFFYPFHFVVSEAVHTIIDAPYELQALKGKRVDTVRKMFKALSESPDMQGASVDDYLLTIAMELTVA